MTHGGSDGDRDLLVGLDVGGTKIVALLTDADGQPLARITARTITDQPGTAAAQLADVIRAACHQAAVPIDRIAAVGVGVPGRVDPDRGVVSLALNLGWHGVPLRDDLEKRVGAPVSVANDVRAAAAGLVERRILGDIENLVYLSIGTGIAAGIILRGELNAGAHQLAGEVGHVVIRADGPMCTCGLRGCLETLAAGSQIAVRAREAIESEPSSSLAAGAREGRLTAADVYDAARDGDELALRITEQAGRALANVIYTLALTLDVQRICIGGGVSNAGAVFLEPIERELDRLRSQSALAAEALPENAVQLLPAGADAGVWGALTLARHGQTQRSVAWNSRREVSERSVSTLSP